MSRVGAFTGDSVGHRAPSTLTRLLLPPAPHGRAVPSAPTRGLPTKNKHRISSRLARDAFPCANKARRGPARGSRPAAGLLARVWPGPRHATAPSLTARHRLRSGSSPRRMHAGSSPRLSAPGKLWHRSRAEPSPEEQRLVAPGSAALSCPRNTVTPAVSPFDPSTVTHIQMRPKQSCCRFALMSAPAQPAPVTAA